eukprot:478456-Ditylum_brightwellii.AAC.1
MAVSGYKYDATRNDGSPYVQLSFLQAAYSAACLAELNVSKIQNIVKKETAGHVMMMLNTTLTAAASIAEKTIQAHTEKACWGCGDTSHLFMARGGKVLCPKAHIPEIRANADR